MAPCRRSSGNNFKLPAHPPRPPLERTGRNLRWEYQVQRRLPLRNLHLHQAGARLDRLRRATIRCHRTIDDPLRDANVIGERRRSDDGEGDGVAEGVGGVGGDADGVAFWGGVSALSKERVTEG